MKSFEEWFIATDKIKAIDPIKDLQTAYNSGSEEKELDMLEFAEWLSWHDSTESIPQAFEYWKKEVKTKKEV